MSDPIVFIVRNRVKAGLLNDFIEHYRDSVPRTESGKPGTLVQLAYLNEDATEVSIVRLFPNADALDDHLQGASERSKKAYEFIEPVSFEIFGRPNPSTVDTMKEIAGSGLVVSVHAHSLGGFVRQLGTSGQEMLQSKATEGRTG
jgi:hypothetical protein